MPELPDNVSDIPVDELVARLKAQHDWVQAALRVPLEHPAAGAVLRFETPQECAQELRRLKKDGLRVPDYALAALEASSTSESGGSEELDGH